MTADGTEGATAAVPATVTGDASDGAGMTDPAAVTTAEPAAPVPAEVTEFAATTLPGWPMAWACLAVMAVGIALTAVGGAAALPGGGVLIIIAGVPLGRLTAAPPRR